MCQRLVHVELQEKDQDRNNQNAAADTDDPGNQSQRNSPQDVGQGFGHRLVFDGWRFGGDHADGAENDGQAEGNGEHLAGQMRGNPGAAESPDGSGEAQN